jgi:PGF-CTERM protein
LYALDAETGDERWSTERSDVGIYSSPTVVDDSVFVVDNDNNLYVVDIKTGDQQQILEIPELNGAHWNVSSPTVVDGTVFVGGGDGLYAVDAGISGKSEGSRVNLGTLGHHHVWANNNSEEQDSAEETDSEEQDSDQEDDSEQQDSAEETASEEMKNTSGEVIANFEYTPSTPETGERVAFDASASVTPNGEIVSYSWNFADGNTGSGKTATHTFEESGGYTVELSVTDNQGEAATTTELLNVEDDQSSSSIPGFGITGTIASLGGVGYMLRRRISENSSSN